MLHFRVGAAARLPVSFFARAEVEEPGTTSVHACGAVAVAVVTARGAVVAAAQVAERAGPIPGCGQAATAVTAAAAGSKTAVVPSAPGGETAVAAPAAAVSASTASAAASSAAAFLVFPAVVNFHKTADRAGSGPGVEEGAKSDGVQEGLAGDPPPGVGVEHVVDEVGQLLGAVRPLRGPGCAVAGSEEKTLQS